MKHKKVVLGVTGGIAIYKALEVISLLKKLEIEVQVIMTRHAREFVTPMTFEAMSGRKVLTDLFTLGADSKIEHIEVAKTADLFVVLPATANIIGKMARGIADDLLSTTLLATKAPVYVAPAMNTNMFEHVSVQENLGILRDRGVVIIEPDAGRLACGDTGKGKLAPPEDIVEQIVWALEARQTLKDKKILVTAGPTVEPIDPVRYITNPSSGRMGFEMARAARALGAEVYLVAGPVNLKTPFGVRRIDVTTSEDMYREVMGLYDRMDIVIKAAAVLDYRPEKVHEKKIKKEDIEASLTLERTRDILKTLGKTKSHQFLVGFAAQTHDVVDYAKAKIRDKNLDFMVANDVSLKGGGFQSEWNEVYLITRDMQVTHLSLDKKSVIAKEILEKIADMVK
ncbi:MAG: phosphopantothenoylcysteine decarboxylase [delta proteobacterium ML8_F1]|nr:MAG: phosphopantothenoylcysteine decarboxylase [delta proteobacterium ML8_F1]